MNTKYFDIAIGERKDGNGGDIQLLGNDLAVVNGNENQVYLALFGGNVEQNTPAVILSNTQQKDYWGNNLFWRNDTERQFNSNTERTLNTVPLNSAGRLKIENAVNDDLKFLKDNGATVTVNVTLPGINTVKINITTVYSNGTGRISVVTFDAKFPAGIDFYEIDFDPIDFY